MSDFDLNFETGRDGYSPIVGTAGDPVISTSYTVNPDCEGAFATCLVAMSGVSIFYDDGTLYVWVMPPFDSAQLDRARAAVMSIDPTADEE